MTATTEQTTAQRPPLWRDVRVLRVAFQVVVVAVVGAIGLWLWNNLQTNSESTGIPLSFDYLDRPSDITVPGNDLRPTQSVLDAVLVGLGNTVRVAAAGIVLATILGTLLGIARLSANWMLSNLARVYVEIIRNIPLLIIIVLLYSAVFLRFPRIDEANSIGNLAIGSVKGVAVVWFTVDGKGALVFALLLVAMTAGWAVHRWRTRVNERTGEPAHGVLAGGAAMLAVALAGHLALGSPVDITTPALTEGGRNVTGGITMLPEYAALLTALVIYTASHIAEIVRGSIQAVPKGQTEAASALALSASRRMRLVVLPQAMRIAVPALGNQYLNLTKNSSLAVAISFFELTKVTSVSIGNRAPAVPSFTLLLFLYLGLSLLISFVVNVANRRLALVER